MHIYRLATLGIAASLLNLLACGAHSDSPIGDEEPRGKTSQPLFVRNGTTLWNPRTVPMCWHELVDIEGIPFTPADQSEIKTFVKQTIRESWQSLTQLNVTWVDCPSSGGQTHVRVRLARETDSNHGTSNLGMGSLTTAQDRAGSTDPVFGAPGMRIAFRRTWNTSEWERVLLRAVIMHEFGHTLGFDHEQDRPDSVDHGCSAAASNPGVGYGLPDPKSIMQHVYCNANNLTLSIGDVAVARSLYGIGRSGTNDFNIDGRSDILWHNSTTGEAQVWFMNQATRVGRSTVTYAGSPVYVGAPFKIVGSNDFNGDGRPDILWHNESTGEVQVWFMNGTAVTYTQTITATADGGGAYVTAPWSIVGTNDFNYDGKTDILWHNNSSGEVQIWYMNGTDRVGRATVTSGPSPIVAGAPWRIAGTRDFTSDGKPDILWHNASSGELRIWHMNGSAFVGYSTVTVADGGSGFVTFPYTIKATYDLDQDGHADVLWYNQYTGEIQIWYMTNSVRTRRAVVDVGLDSDTTTYIGWPWGIMSH